MNLAPIAPPSYPRKLAAVGAGVAVQFVLALILLWVLNAFVGVPTEDPSRLVIGSVPTLDGAPSPARDAGLRSGDVVIAVDDVPASGDVGRLSQEQARSARRVPRRA